MSIKDIIVHTVHKVNKKLTFMFSQVIFIDKFEIGDEADVQTNGDALIEACPTGAIIRN